MNGMAEIVREHWVENWEHPTYACAVRCMADGCDWEGRFPGDIAAHVADVLSAAGYTKPRTITTVEELDGLRTDSTIRSAQGGIWFKETSGKGCAWTEPGAQWWHWPTDIALPATVLYEPTA